MYARMRARGQVLGELARTGPPHSETASGPESPGREILSLCTGRVIVIVMPRLRRSHNPMVLPSSRSARHQKNLRPVVPPPQSFNVAFEDQREVFVPKLHNYSLRTVRTGQNPPLPIL